MNEWKMEGMEDQEWSEPQRQQNVTEWCFWFMKRQNVHLFTQQSKRL